MDIKKFYELTGSDYQAALSIMMNGVLIERMVKKFMENNAYNQILAAYESNNIKEVFTLSHTYKGVTGNLALTKLYQISCDLTEATRDKEEADISDKIEQLKEAYSLVVESYKKCN